MKNHTNAFANIAFNTHQQTLTIGFVDEIQSIHTMCHKKIMAVHSEERERERSEAVKQKTTKTTNRVRFMFVMLDNSAHTQEAGRSELNLSS